MTSVWNSCIFTHAAMIGGSRISRTYLLVQVLKMLPSKLNLCFEFTHKLLVYHAWHQLSDSSGLGWERRQDPEQPLTSVARRPCSTEVREHLIVASMASGQSQHMFHLLTSGSASTQAHFPHAGSHETAGRPWENDRRLCLSNLRTLQFRPITKSCINPTLSRPQVFPEKHPFIPACVTTVTHLWSIS